MQNRQTFVWVYDYIWEKYIWIWRKIIVFSLTFFINFFMETLLETIIYWQTVSLESLATYVCCENCFTGFSAFVLNLSKSGNILFRRMANVCSAQHQLSLVGDNWLVHINFSDGSYSATCKCNISDIMPQSVYGKCQSVIVGKLFSTYKTVFEIAQ